MTKYSLSAASLVTAIPAGFLAYVLVMAFMQTPGFDKMAGFFQIISGLTLVLVTLMVLMPVGILIFGKKPDATPKEDAKQKPQADDSEDLAVEDKAEPKSKAKPKTDEEDIAVDDEDEGLFEEDEFAEDGFEEDGFADDDFDDFDDKKRK